MASGVALTLLMGRELPTPPTPMVTEALAETQVTQSAYGRTGFQLTFNADRTSAFLPDFPMLLTREVGVGIRVVIIVTMLGSLPQVLMDGVITHVDLSHAKSVGAWSITATGEDIGVKMDRTEDTTQFPMMGDWEMAGLVLAKYALYGIVPVVIPTPTSMASNPLERVPKQPSQTDREYLNYLAKRHGYVFTIRPGPIPLTSTAYWGPPLQLGLPQPALTVDMGASTNVDSISFQYDGLAPTFFTGQDQDSETELDVPIDTLFSTRLPLALEPAFLFDGGLSKTKVFGCAGYEMVDAMAYAQGMTDTSTDRVVAASGELDTLRYGAILSTPGLVGVRGCGLSYDGIYRVDGVTHSLKRGEYRQSFQLARNGLVSLTPLVPP